MGSKQHQMKQGKSAFSSDVHTSNKAYAQSLDAEDPLRHLRQEFIIPSKADLKTKSLPKLGVHSNGHEASEPCIYLCGNSLGLQPRIAEERIHAHLGTWATKGVLGHFTKIEDSPLPPWADMDTVIAEQMAHIVGALPEEIAVMETLTANLHLLMSSFYKPTKDRWKIIIERKAFPSDHYAVESQIRHHGLNPAEAMIQIEPSTPDKSTLTTEDIISSIDAHASSTALVLLPGIQYYTGQLFDMNTITAYAHSKGITVGWDLAHAAGNVEVKLHEWDVDFAAWCNYKYLNSGPGAIGGMFVHEKHGLVDMEKQERGQEGYRPRLTGWWGGDKSLKFKMENEFVPIPGAGGYQISNPSAIDLAVVSASLSVFSSTSMSAIRAKSVQLTGYLEHLLLRRLQDAEPAPKPYSIITPSDPDERGAQLSIRLYPGFLETMMKELEVQGVVVDARRPDVIRVAPAPLYNSFEDVWEFVRIFGEAVGKAVEAGGGVSKLGDESTVLGEGREKKGWAEVE
ncbi:MAG: Kynureninase (L-kynurenine hydrolase) [Sclerophora amabilis]|nr:MAG: Kynureninase (L-kynurenine hydrolase) [Sclerophora amabilis]